MCRQIMIVRQILTFNRFIYVRVYISIQVILFIYAVFCFIQQYNTTLYFSIALSS